MSTENEMLKSMSNEQLMALIRKKKKSDSFPKADRSKNKFPQSYAQAGQWYTQQIAGDSIYNIPQCYRIYGQIDVKAFEKALNHLVERHEILRMVFSSEDFKPIQVIRPYKRFPLMIEDLSRLSHEEVEATVKERNREMARMPFDLQTGPNWKFVLMKESDEMFYLTYVIHHIIADAWSMGIMIREITKEYTNIINEKPLLPEPKIQYIDYVEWMEKEVESERIKKQRNYWKEQLKDVKGNIHLAADKQRAAIQTYKGNTLFFTLDEEVKNKLDSFSREKKVSSYHFLLSVFFLLLYQYSKDKDLCVGTPLANRTRSELENIIGLFINMVVIRSQVEEDKIFETFLHEVEALCLRAEENGEVPFGLVLDDLEYSRNPAYTPLYQVMYVQMEEKYVKTNVEISGIKVEPMPVSLETSQYDLSLYVTKSDVSITAYFEYNKDIFSEETIEQMKTDYQYLISDLLENPNRKIGESLEKLKVRKSKIFVLSSFEASLLQESLEYWINQYVLPCYVEFAPYSQVFQQLVFKDSEFNGNTSGINLIAVRLEDWIQGIDDTIEKKRTLLEENTNQFVQAMLHCSNICVLYLCPMSDEMLGQTQMKEMIEENEQKIIEQFKKRDNLIIRKVSEVAKQYELWDYGDVMGDKKWHIPYTRECFAVIGTDFIKELVKKGVKEL